eukprot:gene18834-biopygen14509
MCGACAETVRELHGNCAGTVRGMMCTAPPIANYHKSIHFCESAPGPRAIPLGPAPVIPPFRDTMRRNVAMGLRS